ncbi:unnamed protein product [Moneuplotes crassus]|uniref:RanBP2-type domain-containing protein n=1 Tax=Euplotes crassus TaxID=5936 RepID=A0AAD1UHB9_EUPCR|nr:unnamed protein product [Moneuplotes crassus]
MAVDRTYSCISKVDTPELSPGMAKDKKRKKTFEPDDLSFYPVNSEDIQNEFLNNFSEQNQLTIKDLIRGKDGEEYNVNEILESCKGFQSMLFLTPPKINEMKSSSPSPLIDIMKSLNDILSTDEEKKKVLHPDLIKLLEVTPIQLKDSGPKTFEAKKSSRNISSLFETGKINNNISTNKTLVGPGKNGPNSSNKSMIKFGDTSRPHRSAHFNWTPSASVVAKNRPIIDKKFNFEEQKCPKKPRGPDPISQKIQEKCSKEEMNNNPDENHKNTIKEETKDSSEVERKGSNASDNQKHKGCNNDKENINCLKPQARSKARAGFSFPEGGWVCSFCQNYNFYGRIKCNRYVDGKPQHIIRKETKRTKNDENNMNKMNKKRKNKPKKNNQNKEVNPSGDQSLQGDSKSAQNSKSSKGDWICFTCSNLNFSFRKICNRCQIPREESDSQYASLQVSSMSSCQPHIGFAFPGAFTSSFSNMSAFPPHDQEEN